jgi:hypothetical protein
MFLIKGTVCVRCHDVFLFDHESVQLVLDVTESFLHLHLSLHHLSNITQTVFAAVFFLDPGHYTVKKVMGFPVLPSWDFTNQPLPSRELLNYSRSGRVWLVTSQIARGKSLNFFTVWKLGLGICVSNFRYLFFAVETVLLCTVQRFSGGW